MKIAELLANTIDRMPSDYVFTYSDLNIEVKQKNTVVKALNMPADTIKKSRMKLILLFSIDKNYS
ncbi:MAG: hypothetical protein PHR53_00155 [Bacteroidales bacterium]|nr:hypothetical protein [Bacteroidales bacterium]